MSIATYREFSGSAAQRYENFFVPHIATPFSHALFDRAALRSGEAVLDVACGTGVISRVAARSVGEAGRVTAVDISPDMLEVAAAIPTGGGAPIEWREADAAALPLPDRTFDVVLCQMGLMFFDDQSAAINEMHRVLKPGGRVVINTPDRIQPLFENLGRAISDHISPDLGGFVSSVFSMHDKDELAGLLTEHQMIDVDVVDYNATLDLPAPSELLWRYISITPMAGLVAQVNQQTKTAMEAQMATMCESLVIDSRTPLDQPAVLAAGARAN